MATVYYCSLDHANWTGHGEAGSVTKVPFGDGASSYATERGNLVTGQATLDGQIMADVLAGNKDSNASYLGVCAEVKSGWVSVNGDADWEAELKSIGNGYATPSAFPTKCLEGQTAYAAEAAPAGADVVQFVKADYNTVVGYVNAVLALINNGVDVDSYFGDTVADAQRGKSTLRFSEDLWHFVWYKDPQYCTGGSFGTSNPTYLNWTNTNADSRMSIEVRFYCATHAVWWTAGESFAYNDTGTGDIYTGHGGSGHSNTKALILVRSTATGVVLSVTAMDLT
jgi:hypothetical protein